MVSYHLTKLGGYKHCGSGNIMVLICHMTSQDHVIQWLCDFMGGSQCPTMFCSHRHGGMGNIMILVCQKILQHHVIKGSCNFMSRSPST